MNIKKPEELETFDTHKIVAFDIRRTQIIVNNERKRIIEAYCLGN